MKNSTLVIRSFLIVAIIAGIPHLLALYAKSDEVNEIVTEAEITESIEPVEESWAPYWPGKYEVSFQELEEKAVYEIRKEGGQLKAYSIELIDNKGNRFKDNSLVMEEIKIEENLAKADYEIEYEGEKFKVGCQMEMDNEGNIILTYEYYGYEGKETWKRI